MKAVGEACMSVFSSCIYTTFLYKTRKIVITSLHKLHWARLGKSYLCHRLLALTFFYCVVISPPPPSPLFVTHPPFPVHAMTSFFCCQCLPPLTSSTCFVIVHLFCHRPPVLSLSPSSLSPSVNTFPLFCHRHLVLSLSPCFDTFSP